MKKNLSGVICIIVAGVCWGFFPIFTRMLYSSGVGVFEAVSARALVAGIIYLVWGVVRGVFKGLGLRDWLFFLVYGCCSLLGTYIFYALAIRYLSSAMAAMLLYTAPAFVIILSRIFYGEPITKAKFTALLLTFAGSCLVVKIYDTESLSVNFLGIIFGLLSGISYSTLTVIGRHALSRGYTALANTFTPAISVALVMGIAVPPWTIPLGDAKMLLCYLAVGVIGSVLPYFFYQKGLASGLDGGFASILSNVEPVSASIFGVIFFADSLEPLQLLGIAVVILGAGAPMIFTNETKKGAVA